jgi:hypothetical protein
MPNRFQNLEPATRLYLEKLAAQNDPPLSRISLAEARFSRQFATATWCEDADMRYG